MKGAKGKGAARNSREALKPVDDRKVGKRKAVVKVDKSSKRQAKKPKSAKKDPNKPKRPPSAFFVGKAGGEKWKSMSDAEKAPYEAKAKKRKSDYEKLMKAYNKKQESMAEDGDEESDRSKSEVNDEDEEDAEEGQHEDDDDDGEEEEEEEEDEDEDDD
nr:isoform 2 of high mobility group b protein 1 [Quercus suber]